MREHRSVLRSDFSGTNQSSVRLTISAASPSRGTFIPQQKCHTPEAACRCNCCCCSCSDSRCETRDPIPMASTHTHSHPVERGTTDWPFRHSLTAIILPFASSQKSFPSEKRLAISIRLTRHSFSFLLLPAVFCPPFSSSLIVHHFSPLCPVLSPAIIRVCKRSGSECVRSRRVESL